MYIYIYIYVYIHIFECKKVTTGASSVGSLMTSCLQNNHDDQSEEYKGYTIAIQDDYKYWHTHNESDESGKLLLIHTEDDCSSSNDDCSSSNDDYSSSNGDNNDDNNYKNNDKINNDNYNNDKKIDNNNKNIDNCYRNNIDKIQIFFDDNIERNRSHIVDVRDIKTFKHIPFNDIKNIYIKKIEPYYAIIDDNYYINIVQEMVENQSSSHKD